MCVVVILLVRRLLTRVFCDGPEILSCSLLKKMGRCVAQEQVDRDTPESSTLTVAPRSLAY
jgi:hypothetical protein